MPPTLALSGVRSGLSVIGHRAAPEVVSTSGVYFALNDMDAQVANVLLVANRNDLGSTPQQSMDLYDNVATSYTGAKTITSAVRGQLRDPATRTARILKRSGQQFARGRKVHRRCWSVHFFN